jgi:peptidoglycan hydrolase-like protein with peptidoglycan-binding domain
MISAKGDDMFSISAPTGAGGSNVKRDVSTIQILLNFHVALIPPTDGVDIDGQCGKQTIKAIADFQRIVMKQSEPDGCVHPGRETWQRLIAGVPTAPASLRGKPLGRRPAQVLRDILEACGLASAYVTSVERTPEDQARVMFEDMQGRGTRATRNMYAAPGQRVVDAGHRRSGASPESTIAAMAAEIRRLGPSSVSRHCSDSHYVFDIDPESIYNRPRFVKVVGYHKAVSTFIAPPLDAAFHLEIPRQSPFIIPR